MTGLKRSAFVLATLLALAACDNAEQRAAKHLKNALELLEAGDAPRAFVEFRNVLRLDQDNREARLTYARAARDIGNTAESYAQFLFLAEADPDEVEARLALSEMAILAQNWNEANRHGSALLRLTAENPIERADIVDAALKFRAAFVDDNRVGLRELTREAEALADTYPQDPILSRLLIEGYANDNRLDDAITVASDMLEADPENPLFYQVMAELLITNRDMDGLEAHFRRTIQTFPQDNDAKGDLIRLLLSQGRGDSAEAFLRDEIATSDKKLETHVSLIALIRQRNGDRIALEEVETALQAYDQPPLLQALKAGMLFDLGQRDEAIALLQSVTEGVEASAETDRFRVTLARMLLAEGNEVGARQLVEQVLEFDPGQVAALKMRAEWQIDGDETDAAIATLRLALDQDPENAEAMTLLARAHDRNGDRQLARDLLALAVEASRNAPAESIRFALRQISEERYTSAEDALINALRRAPQNLDLLRTLGQVYLETADWGRGEQVIASLRRLDTEDSNLAAEDLELKVISRREGREQGVGFLEQLVQNGSDNLAATAALIQVRISEGKGEEALELAQTVAAANEGDLRGALLLGNTYQALGQFSAAETVFRDLAEQAQNNPGVIMQLMRALTAQGRLDEALEQVDVGLSFAPQSFDLLWAKASIFERQTKIDEAIEIYETLYALNSDQPVIANNLASLLVTYRKDDASLERAFAVGKRLRGTDFAPFQDTYGWLLHRRGEYDEAVGYLEAAAANLQNDPIVQYHLGQTYLALGRDADALAQFERAVAVAVEGDTRDQIVTSRMEIERLSVKQTE
jgi:predicted Zn-dependent protease